jgi:hypothetical protein
MPEENTPAPFRFLKGDEFAALPLDEALKYLQRAVEELKRPINYAEEFLSRKGN